MTLLDAALAFAAQGVAVFPCKPGEKVPACAHGCKDATTDPEQIRAWWTRNPDFNVAIATGSASKMAVADLDVKDGANGLDSLLTLEPHPLPTVCAWTPHDGCHRYHLMNGEPVRNRANVVPGVDVRGEGGYVLAPPSVVDGKPYRWHTGAALGELELAPVPEWMLEPKRQERQAVPPRTTRIGETTRYGRAALDRELAALRSAQVGERNETLNRCAFALSGLVKGGEIDPSDAGELRATALAVGLEPKEVEKTLRSAYDAADSRCAPRRHVADRHGDTARDNVAAAGAPDAAPGPERDKPIEVVQWHALEPLATNWLIGGVVPESACVVCGAEMKTGKTWFLLELALALAGGAKVLDRWDAGRRGKTLIVSPEGTQNGLVRRLHGLCWGHGLKPDEVGPLTPVWPERLDLANEQSVARLVRGIIELEPDMLIIDPLVTATGGVDENDAGAMQAALNKVRDLQRYRPSMAILVAHHVNKGGDGKQSLWHRLRGSSALGAWADGLIALQRSSDDPDATRRVDIWHRDDPSPEPCGFDLGFQQSHIDGVPVVRLEGVDCPQKQHRGADNSAQNETQNLLMALIASRPGQLTAKSLSAEIVMPHRTVARHVASLIEQKRVIRGDNRMLVAVGAVPNSGI